MVVICAKRGGYVQVVSEGCREAYVQRVARRTVRVMYRRSWYLGLDDLLLLGGLRGGLALLPLPEAVLGHDAGLCGLRDARRRHDPTGPLRHRDLCLLAVSKAHYVLTFAAHRFPCSTGASAPRPRPARTRTASSPCRSKRSASSDTTRAHVHIFCPYRSHGAARGFFF